MNPNSIDSVMYTVLEEIGEVKVYGVGLGLVACESADSRFIGKGVTLREALLDLYVNYLETAYEQLRVEYYENS